MAEKILTLRGVAKLTGEKIETVRASARAFKNGSNGKRALEHKVENTQVGPVCYVTQTEANRWHRAQKHRAQLTIPFEIKPQDKNKPPKPSVN